MSFHRADVSNKELTNFVEGNSRESFPHRNEPVVDHLSLNTILSGTLGGVNLHPEGGGITIGTKTHHNCLCFTNFKIFLPAGFLQFFTMVAKFANFEAVAFSLMIGRELVLST